MRLVTIRFSHFCEKARWGLDHCGVPYIEDGHLPGFHLPPLKRANAKGRKDRASTSFSTPTLLLDDGTSITDSSEILKFASSQMKAGTLYPNEKAADGATVDELEQRVHDGVAIHSRRLAYSFLLNDLPNFRRLCRANRPGVEATVLAVGAPFIKKRFMKFMKIDDDTEAKAVAVIDEAFDAFSALVNDRAFVVGDSLSAADISFAAGVAPALVIHESEGYGAPLPALEELPPRFLAHAERWRATDAGKYVLRLFRDHRGERLIPFGATAPSVAGSNERPRA